MPDSISEKVPLVRFSIDAIRMFWPAPADRSPTTFLSVPCMPSGRNPQTGRMPCVVFGPRGSTVDTPQFRRLVLANGL